MARFNPADRAEFVAGARAAVPLGLAGATFGLAYGVAVTESSLAAWLGVAASWIVLAGASQLSMVSLIDQGSSWPVVVGTALVINARMALYSTALAPSFSQFPKRWRFGLAYLVTDQSASLAMLHFDTQRDPSKRRWWFFGAALLFASLWWVGTVVGVVLGGSIPEQLDVGFAVPAMFIALVVPSLTSRPAVVAAVVGGLVAVLAAPLPNGLNIMVAALCGIVSGRIALERRAMP